jgi:NADH-quinone oxidoreductase subunit C
MALRTAEQLLEISSSLLGAKLLSSSTRFNDLVITVPAVEIKQVLTMLRDSSELQFNLLSSLTAVDKYPQEPRFELVYDLYSVALHDRIRVKVALADTGSEQQLPSIESVCEIFLTANWHEREVYDLFGIRFKHHPDLRRILLPENWDGHPLRRDYPYDGKPVWKLGASVAEPDAKFDILEN